MSISKPFSREEPDDAPTPEPRILLHHNIPKPLHGVAPRVILGSVWWSRVRRAAKHKAKGHCMACGVWQYKAEYHQWLECHEEYIYDWAKYTLYYSGAVAICHSCHNYIHSGRMRMLLESGEMSQEKYDTIRAHGDKLTRGLQRYALPKIPMNTWAKWRMIVNGKRYGPSTKNMKSWKDGDWRGWKP